MACLALSIQPLRGPDILLQTREWFPPARAAAASHSFQTVREAFDTASSSASTDIVGDDALAASSGQVVVGEDSRFRVVYRLVNSVYVLGISSADQDDCSNNVFDCTSTVNQAVSILVAACRGVDVTAEKVGRRYAEVYLALDAVLHGASSSQLRNLVAAFSTAGTAAAAVVAAGGTATADPSAVSWAEVHARGADTWDTVRQGPLQRVSTGQELAHTAFDLPEAVLRAGDAVMEAQGVTLPKETPPTATPEAVAEEPRDPFALSAPKGDDFDAGFSRAAGTADSVAALAELSAGLAAMDGGPGGTGFGGEEAAGFQDFEAGEDAFGGDQLVAGFGEEAFGGGFDGLALDDGAPPSADAAATGDALALALATATGPAPLPNQGLDWAAVDDAHESRAMENGAGVGPTAGASGLATRLPILWLTEQVHAEFEGATLRRAGVQGELRMQAPPRKLAAGSEETLQLAFRLDGAAGIKSTALNKQAVTAVGPGVFHARIAPSPTAAPPVPLVLSKYRLAAATTPLPLRLHLATRRGPNGRLAVLLQYVANPALVAPLSNVMFLISLPFSPDSVRFSPKGVWVKKERQVRWTVPLVVPGAAPGRLRVLLTGVAPQQSLANLHARVVTGGPGSLLSAMFLRPASDTVSPPFAAGEHSWGTGVYCAYPVDKSSSVLGDEFSVGVTESHVGPRPVLEEAAQRESTEVAAAQSESGRVEDGEGMQEGGAQSSDFFQPQHQEEVSASGGYDHEENVSAAGSQKMHRFDSFGFDAFGDEPSFRPQDGLNRQPSSAFDSPKLGELQPGQAAVPFSSQSLNFF